MSRPTAYGRETIVVDSTGTEQFLTVERRQGKHDWQWRLDTDAHPRLQPDGSIIYGAGLARTPPVAILDAGGKDVTPDGLRWSLREQDGSWRLGLQLDDSKLPLPYLVDPAVDYPSPLYLSSQASTETGSWKLITAAPAASNITTSTTPAQNATGYYLFIPGAGNTTAAAPPANPTGTGWVLDTAGGTGFPTGQLDLHGHDRRPERHATSPGRQSSTSASGRGRLPAGSSRRPALFSRRPTTPQLRTCAPP